MSILGGVGLLSASPTWRCPHCRTLQPESTRCRACSRAAVSCATCQRYRRSIAADLGYCANDRARAPLGGDEVRSCWEQAPGSSGAVAGLFDEAELLPSARSEPPARPEPPSIPATAASPSSGRLIDAPHVAPGRVLMSELERRARGDRG